MKIRPFDAQGRQVLVVVAGVLVAGVLLAVGLAIGSRAEPPYSTLAEKAAVEERIRSNDREMLLHGEGYWGDDAVSYYARAENFSGVGYLERRTPYVFRFLYPLIASVAHRTSGLSLLTVTVWLSAAALAIIGFATAMIATAIGLRARDAALVGLAAGLVPGLAKLVESPAYTDLIGAAFVTVAILAALRDRWLLSGLLLCLAIWTRETNLLFAAPIGALAWHRGERHVATTVAATALAAYALPHLLFSASATYPLISTIRHGLRAKLELRAWIDYLPNGLTIFLPAALLAIAQLRRRDPILFVGMGAWLGGFLVLGVFSADAARLMGSAAPLVVALAAGVLPQRERSTLLVIAIVGGVLHAVGSGAAFVLTVGFVVASALTLNANRGSGLRPLGGFVRG